ncbi:hypothetical protein CERZMDRAFT_83262 [Cercospora zeae-maydis SCOH1-5]|uniref:Uncharacterized protein n=1 Tax=Cercospora zeae-maydis SCOH1-5 TaxID=717836 RepID=A0A6A6FKA1_9PEZI|nr:hypothetical protein CERZMDRAFT_83262 [Cercospora zeae-maydis SCOH1-5]
MFRVSKWWPGFGECALAMVSWVVARPALQRRSGRGSERTSGRPVMSSASRWWLIQTMMSLQKSASVEMPRVQRLVSRCNFMQERDKRRVACTAYIGLHQRMRLVVSSLASGADMESDVPRMAITTGVASADGASTEEKMIDHSRRALVAWPLRARVTGLPPIVVEGRRLQSHKGGRSSERQCGYSIQLLTEASWSHGYEPRAVPGQILARSALPLRDAYLLPSYGRTGKTRESRHGRHGPGSHVHATGIAGGSVDGTKAWHPDGAPPQRPPYSTPYTVHRTPYTVRRTPYSRANAGRGAARDRRRGERVHGGRDASLHHHRAAVSSSVAFSGACKTFCRRTLTGHTGRSSQPCLECFTLSAGVRGRAGPPAANHSRAQRIAYDQGTLHAVQPTRTPCPPTHQPVDAPASDHT